MRKWLRKPGLLSLEERGLKGHFITMFQYLKVLTEMMETPFLQGVTWKRPEIVGTSYF